MIIKSVAWYTFSLIYVPISATARINHKKLFSGYEEMPADCSQPF